MKPRKEKSESIRDLFSNGTPLGWLALFAMACLTGWMKWHTYDEPLECDEISFAVFGHKLLQGGRFYVDVGDNKPPLIYLTFASAEWMAGYGRPAIALLWLAATLAGSAGLFAIGRKLSGKTATGLLAALLWTFVSGDAGLIANQPRSETFMNDLTIWIFLFYLVQKKESFDAPHTVGMGFLFLLDSLYKPFTAVPFFLASIQKWILEGGLRKGPWLRQSLMILSVMGAGWGAVFGYFGLTGRLPLFWEALVERGAAHVGNIGTNLLCGLAPQNLMPVPALFLLPLAAVSLLGLVAGFRKQRAVWSLWLIFCLSTFIEVALPGHFYQYYYQLWMPLACIGAAWGLEILWKQAGKIQAVVLALAVLLSLVIHQWRWYRNSAVDISYGKFGDNFVYNDSIGKIIDDLLLPRETLYEWSSIPHFYLSARRDPPSSLLFEHELFFPPPLGPRLCDRVIGELSANRPELLVIDRYFELAGFRGQTFTLERWKQNPVYQYLQGNYRFFMSEADGRFLFLYLKGGELERRLVNVKNLPAVEKYKPNFH